jgi:hypothetical protein
MNSTSLRAIPHPHQRSPCFQAMMRLDGLTVKPVQAAAQKTVHGDRA